MTFKRTPMRYAHTNGFTSCIYTENGSMIITAGADGDMRKWQGIDDDDPTSECLGECILNILHYDDRLLVSNDLNVVQAYTYPAIERDGIVFNFTTSVTCIKVNKKYIAASSDDGEIKVLKRDGMEPFFSLKGHQGPILHMDINDNDIIASASGDGSLKVWDLNKQEELKTVTSNLPKCKAFERAKVFSTPCFQPKLWKSMVYPNGKQIVIVSTTNWEEQTTLTDDDVKGDYSCCSFSHCGQYLAAGTDTGEVSVWEFMKKELLRGETETRESEGITMITWNPKNNGEFAYCDSTGQLGTVVDCNKVAKGNADIIPTESDEVNFGDLQFVDDEAVEDDASCVSLEKLKNETMKGVHGNDDIDDDDKESISSRSTSVERVVMKTYTQQPPFQPGSSPKDLEHRYLVWNNVGIVRAHATDDEGSIDVEFHDASVHHAIYMKNYLNHTMGSLSSTVLALAGDTSTKLVCITFGGGGSREWSVEMPDCEGILAVIATKLLVAVATENRFLRIFSVRGTQRGVVSIPGPVVALAGQDNKLMVAYHSAPANEDQYISLMLIQSFGLTLRCRSISLPLAPRKKLSWIGYSDCGSPVFYDTSGMVQMYSSKANLWYPICNTVQHAQSISNNFFLIDVIEKIQMVQVVLCRTNTYPPVSPRPIVSELPMQMPFCEIEIERSVMEEAITRNSTFSVDDSEKIITENAIKLFALACRSEMEPRARELVEMIASPQLIPLVVKYASKIGRIHLADRLAELLPRIEEEEKEREIQMKEAEMEAVNLLQNSPLNSGLLLLNKAMTPSTAPSPQVTPKPLSVSQLRRNPFKRSSTGTPNRPKENPLKHLTEKAIGYESKKPEETVEEESTASPADNDTNPPPVQNNESEDIFSSGNDENKAKNENTTTPINFMTWFTQNKEELKSKYPDITPAELTKAAMKEYKMMSINVKNSPPSGKRKLESDGTEKQSGIAKLAKFGFKK